LLVRGAALAGAEGASDNGSATTNNRQLTTDE